MKMKSEVGGQCLDLRRVGAVEGGVTSSGVGSGAFFRWPV